jgi:DNA-binding MarR family transcriptional regulator
VAPLVSRLVERLLAGHDPPLTLAQYLALEAVAEGDVAGVELARRAAVSPAAVSQLVAALEDASLIARALVPDDRRRQPLVLTDAGEGALRSVRRLLRDRLGALLGELPPPETEALTRALERLDAILQGQPPPRRPHAPPPRPPPG